MMGDVIRQLRIAQIDDPEFAHQYQQTIDRLLKHQDPPVDQPMIYRTGIRATCPKRECDDCQWHGTPCACGCPTSAYNLVGKGDE